MQQFPFGLWKSPVDASFYARAGGRIQQIQAASDGVVYVSVSKDGQSHFYLFDPIAGQRRLNGTLRVSGSVGYGGGDFDVSSHHIVYAVPGSGLFVRGKDRGAARPLVRTQNGVASPAISPDERFVVYVESDGADDWLALVPLDGGDLPRRIVYGADFYMQPCWSGAGNALAWTEWNHPNMAWSGGVVRLASFDGATGQIGAVRDVAGGSDFPASQPSFSPDGRFLTFIQTTADWQDLILFDVASGERRILIKGERVELAPPAFAQGSKTYDWLPDGKRIVIISRTGVRATLDLVTVETRETEKIALPERYSAFDSVSVSPATGAIATVAVSPFEDPVVLSIEDDGAVIRTVFRLSFDEVDEAWIAKPRDLSWESVDGDLIHGVFYAPTNPDFGWNGKPPALVTVHGGPTGIKDLRFSAERTYFTSRGYGWLDVNYRGSSGYGRKYLEALNGFWGWNDVEDVISGANTIAKFGLADRARMAVMGGSAGGYTVLNCLSQFPDSFKAGISLYGVTNLYSLSLDTHKIELHYNDSLVGTLPKDDIKYRDWSPAFHAERIKAPLAIFQGEDDPVVPLAQAKEFEAKVRGPKVVRYYAGEGHGFRKPETNLDYIRTVDGFLKDYL